MITQLVNYETKKVINHNRTTADKGSASSACSITAHQEQILPARIASQKLKISNGPLPRMRNVHTKANKGLWIAPPLLILPTGTFLRSMPQKCTAPFSFIFAL
ncbi:MAG TPA: hypothetical protein DCG77_19505 [Sphingobacterium sp.]|nr:hypothetical protein [Sphingobacterium sp.]